jgi:hypothetical protein
LSACLPLPAAVLPVVAEEEADPNSAEVDGLAFYVDAEEGAGEAGDDDEELDPAEVEFVEDIPAEVRV